MLYSITYYKLDLILAIGYRVRSPRGTQFRQWATTDLREFLVKGFVMDDQRLKDPKGWDYFDELLARNREWFLVPLPVVEAVVERIKDGTISDYMFDVETACLKRRGK